MDHVPVQNVRYSPRDEATVVCHIDTHIRVRYEDWNGEVQERTVGRGTWPLRTRMMIGYRTKDPSGAGGWSNTLHDLSELTPGIEVSVGESASMELPRQMRRSR